MTLCERQPQQDLHVEAEDRSECTAEQRLIVLNNEEWNAFMAALDAPPREHPRLRRLFSESSVFERAEPEP